MIRRGDTSGLEGILGAVWYQRHSPDSRVIVIPFERAATASLRLSRASRRRASSLDHRETVGITFGFLAGVLAFFQIALALGKPWGAASYGGGNPGVLPTRLRAVSAIFGFWLYPIVILFVLDASGVADTGLANGSRTEFWLWFLAGLFRLGTLANFASRSKTERVWVPVTLVLCCGILAVTV
jgi:hypothetical protein